MRLPVTPQISTKDGVSAKNARLTNCLKETTKRGDMAVIRPGLVTQAEATGVGGGLVAFNNELVSVYGATLGADPIPESINYLLLGALGTGIVSGANAVSSDGSVIVGGSRTTGSNLPYHAWRYASGTMTDLGVLGSDTYTNATDVSDDGLVVVGLSILSSTSRAFRWTSGGGMVSLGTGSTSAYRVFVSSDGNTAAGVKGSNDSFVWTSGGGYVTLTKSGIFAQALAYGLSKDGTTIVGTALDLTSSYYRAFYWTSGTGIVSLWNGVSTDEGATCVSGDGSVIGGAYESAGCIWNQAGTRTDIPMLSGGSAISVVAISRDSTTVVGTCTVAGLGRGYYWTSGGGTVDLGDGPTGFLSITVTGVSSDGDEIFGKYTKAGSIVRPFKWTAATGIVDVGDSDVSYAWVIPSAISADGTTIVGTAETDNGVFPYYPFSTLASPAYIPALATIATGLYDFAQSPI